LAWRAAEQNRQSARFCPGVLEVVYGDVADIGDQRLDAGVECECGACGFVYLDGGDGGEAGNTRDFRYLSWSGACRSWVLVSV
jgi:hypothetical protein